MNLKLIESFVELIELGAFANKEDIVKGLNSAIKVTKEQAELTDEEILKQLETVIGSENFEFSNDPMWIKFARAILRKARE
jgi:hypothetical protein